MSSLAKRRTKIPPGAADVAGAVAVAAGNHQNDTNGTGTGTGASAAPGAPPVPTKVDPGTVLNQAAVVTGDTSLSSISTRASSEGRAQRKQKTVSQEVSDTLYSFKLLEALRNGDPNGLQPFLAAAAATYAQGKGGASQEVKELTSPLHMAVRCAEDSTIASILRFRSPNGVQAFDLNAQESQHGNTALHIASMTGRFHTVQMLLEQPGIDDMKRNKEGKEPLEVASSPAVAQLFQVSRAQLQANFLQALAAYEKLRPEGEQRIYELLQMPRYRVLDLNAQSPDSGSTLLHEAVKRKDTRMIETAAQKGGDVFCRDRKGKRVLDIARDEKIRALLRQLSNAGNGILQQTGQPTYGPPSFKGYIGKWTNQVGRYKPRWFVLENGTLSYYHTQEDEGKQMRGSINLRYAKVRADRNDNHGFEIISDSNNSRTASKLYLRGSHPVERARWVQLLQQTQDFFNLERTQSREGTHNGGGNYGNGSGTHSGVSSTLPTRNPSVASLVQPQPVLAGATGIAPASGSASVRTAPSLRAPTPPVRPASGLSDRSSSASGGAAAAFSTFAGGAMTALAPSHSAQQGDTPSMLSRISDSPTGEKDGYEFSLLDDDEETDGLDGADSIAAAIGKRSGAGKKSKNRRTLPYDMEFVIVGNSLVTQAQLGNELADALSAGENNIATRAALQQSVTSIAALLSQYQTMVSEREAYLIRRYEQEIQAKQMWEENMKVLAQQHAEMETALKEASEENARKRKALREVRGSMMVSSPGSGLVMSPSLTAHEGDFASPATATSPSSGLADRRDAPGTISLDGVNAKHGRRSSYMGGFVSEDLLAPDAVDEDDEFFDAIESGSLPLKVEKEIESPTTERDIPEPSRSLLDSPSAEPYKKIRHKLPIGKDDRPSVSLWAILKNNIGKDLTKISFPVSFNEPTSMLQRMAEDMEFSECLDVASSCEDSTKRIAYVGAFAMSNYSSTIGRIAKPFNPLLGETFEYVAPEKAYRYLSEQVSHHPPISACFAESPSWEYFGCVDAKNKFTGRTFEIRPTGVAHANLKVPKSWIPRPKKQLQPCRGHTDRVYEHYTWNKVTTSVSGFLVGAPTIDHFGDMEITNHATGDKCVLTFKPRGWRGKDAFEIRGAVYDAAGKQVWDIAGRWNSQLVARRCGAGSGELNPDEQVGSGGVPAPQAEYLLLWKNSEKPPTPFNLPPFAITLNDLPDGLHPWLPPTDCRLRPDLRAFESGKFDQANGLKQGLEELQRATRRKREAGELPPHAPRWFKRVTDPDSQDMLWKPEMHSVPYKDGYLPPEYWMEREKVGSIRYTKGEKAAEWERVDHIFGEFEV